MQSDCLLESLEPRALLSVSLSSSGWTSFSKSSDTRIVYVSSSSGSDSNSGLSIDKPVKSLGRAKSLVRDGKPDWMLLKSGDTFSGGIGPWKTSGRSSQEMQRIGNYGSGNRPVLKSGTKEGFVTFGGTGHPIDNVAITGLSFIADTYNGHNGSFSTTGIRLTRQGTNWLVENCCIQGYKDNVTLDADGSGMNHFTMRRCEILNAYAAAGVGNGHAQGIYVAKGTKNTLLEDNLFDHNGWNASVSGAGPTGFNHDIYVNSGASGTVIRGNTISRASYAGITMRSSAVIQDNLIIRCPMGINIAGAGSTISGNVIMEGTELAGSAGIEVAGLSGITISNNIIAHEKASAKYHITGIRLDNGVKNATISGNIIYDWQQSINNGGSSGITIKNNQLQDLDSTAPLLDQVAGANSSAFHYSGNIYGTPRSKVNRLNNSDKTLAAWVSATRETGAKAQTIKYVAPNRAVGGGSFDSWISSARAQSQTNWKTAFSTSSAVGYIRDGFKFA
jgi:hypothetical protein